MEKKRKYILFSKEDGRPDSVKPCAFFYSQTGCKNGAQCKFSHTTNSESKIESNLKAAAPTVSTNQNMLHDKSVSTTKKTKTAIAKTDTLENKKDNAKIKEELLAQKKLLEEQQKLCNEQLSLLANSKVSESNNNDIFEYDEPNKDDDDDESFLFDAVNTVLEGKLETPHDGNPYPTTQTKLITNVVHSLPNPVDQSTKKPVKSNETTIKKEPNTPQKTSHNNIRDIFANPKTVANETVSKNNGSNAKAFDPTNVDFNSLDWDPLVATTSKHPKYEKSYKFTTDNTWVTSKPYGPWCSNRTLPTVLAIDCEMCEATDPVTGAKDNALVRFSVVNGRNPSEIVFDSLVQPMLNITNMRTEIHGITEDQIKDVKYTLRHAQATLLDLCVADRTVLIGHSLYSDLKALRFVHYRVVDTVYLYSVENKPESLIGLRDIASQTLGIKLPDVHDSVQDARSSLYAAALILLHGAQRPIPKGIRQDNHQGGVVDGKKVLLIHRIPDFCTEEHIEKMIVTHSQIVPIKVFPIVRNVISKDEAGLGKANVLFSSEQHALLAFNSISGPARPDKQNKIQKRIYLKNGGYVCIRTN